MEEMTEQEIERIGRAWKRSREIADGLYDELHEALVTGYNAGIATMTLVHRSGLAREVVRRTLSAAELDGRLTRPRPRSKSQRAAPLT